MRCKINLVDCGSVERDNDLSLSGTTDRASDWRAVRSPVQYAKSTKPSSAVLA